MTEDHQAIVAPYKYGMSILYSDYNLEGILDRLHLLNAFGHRKEQNCRMLSAGNAYEGCMNILKTMVNNSSLADSDADYFFERVAEFYKFSLYEKDQY